MDLKELQEEIIRLTDLNATLTNEIENLVNDMEMDYQKTFNQLEKIIEFKGRMKYNLKRLRLY